MSGSSLSSRVRPARFAGSWYPAQPNTLQQLLDDFMRQAFPVGDVSPRGIVVPHAGIVYSGPVAASAYAALDRDYDVVVLLGTSHRYRFDTLSVYAGKSLETPLGPLPVHRAIAATLLAHEECSFIPEVHEQEHSLEMQYPFVRYRLGGIPVVPIMAASEHSAGVAETISDAVRSHAQKPLFIASTDLSHYHPYEEAQRLDRRTADAIAAGAIDALDEESLCGKPSVKLFLNIMEIYRAHGSVVDLRTSGDIRPETKSGGVVGYAAIVFTEKEE